MLTGGCYCGALRYAGTEKAVAAAQCHCRPCQIFAGGGPQYFMLIPEGGFVWTKGTPKTYQMPGLKNAVTRAFCGICGTQIVTRRQDRLEYVLKVGTLDKPETFRRPHAAICLSDAQPYHHVPADIPQFEGLPPV